MSVKTSGFLKSVYADLQAGLIEYSWDLENGYYSVRMISKPRLQCFIVVVIKRVRETQVYSLWVVCGGKHKMVTRILLWKLNNGTNIFYCFVLLRFRIQIEK